MKKSAIPLLAALLVATAIPVVSAQYFTATADGQSDFLSIVTDCIQVSIRQKTVRYAGEGGQSLRRRVFVVDRQALLECLQETLAETNAAANGATSDSSASSDNYYDNGYYQSSSPDYNQYYQSSASSAGLPDYLFSSSAQAYSSSSAAATTSSADEGPVGAAIQDFSFQPDVLRVTKGTTITWTNLDSAPHTVTGDNGGPASPTLQQGQTYSYTFNDVGAFPFHCTIHPHMTGTVIVTE